MTDTNINVPGWAGKIGIRANGFVKTAYLQITSSGLAIYHDKQFQQLKQKITNSDLLDIGVPNNDPFLIFMVGYKGFKIVYSLDSHQKQMSIWPIQEGAFAKGKPDQNQITNFTTALRSITNEKIQAKISVQEIAENTEKYSKLLPYAIVLGIIGFIWGSVLGMVLVVGALYAGLSLSDKLHLSSSWKVTLISILVAAAFIIDMVIQLVFVFLVEIASR